MGIYYLARHRYHIDSMYPVWEKTGGSWLMQRSDTHGYRGLEPDPNVSLEDLTENDIVITNNSEIPGIKDNSNNKFIRVEMMQHSPGMRSGINSIKSKVCDYGIVGTDAHYNLDQDDPTYSRMIEDGRVFQCGAWTKKVYLDQFDKFSPTKKPRTVLLAPANIYTTGGYLSEVGIELIHLLHDNGFHVMLMPHELDIFGRVGKRYLKDIENEVPESVELLYSKDTGINKVKYAFENSDICISDFSGTSYEYAYTGKPLIHLTNTRIDRWSTRTKGHHTRLAGPLLDFYDKSFLSEVTEAVDHPDQFIKRHVTQLDEILIQTIGKRDHDPVTPAAEYIIKLHEGLSNGSTTKKKY
ncbi:CDP-glycerol:poly(glycerophosphate) glycerophosphotransferase [Listeria phage LIS04]|nr:CDP-glycerol:poly(glycerophosphate) glycerophosphotransferase [Listeria phage LIS04]